MKCEKSLWCVNESVNIGNRIHVRVDTSGYLSSPFRAVHVQYNTGYPPGLRTRIRWLNLHPSRPPVSAPRLDQIGIGMA